MVGRRALANPAPNSADFADGAGYGNNGLMHVDHLTFAVGPKGLKAEAKRLGELLGEEFINGGFHPRFGTQNRILPLADGRVSTPASAPRIAFFRWLMAVTSKWLRYWSIRLLIRRLSGRPFVPALNWAAAGWDGWFRSRI
jgi:hypothetical protein